MPFKSEAQRRKFGELVKQGKMKQSTFDEFNKNTSHKLPDRVKKSSAQITSIDEIRKKAKLKK